VLWKRISFSGLYIGKRRNAVGIIIFIYQRGGNKMPTHTLTQEQYDEIISCLLKIQMNIDNKETINGAVKDIYKILYTETERKIYNPVTGKYYSICKRSGVNKNAGEIKGMWKDKSEK
jgi:hypothetical protein